MANLRRTDILRILIIVALGGLTLIQWLWVGRSYELQRLTFDQSARTAIRQVSERLESAEFNRFIRRNPRFADVRHWASQTLDSSKVAYSYRYQSNDSVMMVDTEILATDSFPQTVIVSAQTAPTVFEFRHDTLKLEDDLTRVRRYVDRSVSKPFRVRLDTARRIKLIKQAVTGFMAPIRRPLRIALVDSLLRIELNDAGLDVNYQFALQQGSLYRNASSEQLSKDAPIFDSPYRTQLFRDDFVIGDQFLYVDFPGQSQYIWRQLSPIILISIGLLGALIYAFVISMRTIYSQNRLSNLKNDFINNMTHELKTPISSIALAGEALSNPKNAEAPNRIKRYADIIRDENRRLAGQVDKILQMAAIEKGHVKLKRETLHLHDLIERAVDTVSMRIQDRNGQLRVHLNALDDRVFGDRLHLTNILFNLLDNAVKYSPEAPDIEIRTESNRHNLQFTVSDQGMGMTVEQVNHAFDSFYRGQSGNVHDVQGFGLGLSYVKAMVQAHEGDIAIDSEPGRGTSVTVSIPLGGDV